MHHISQRSFGTKELMAFIDIPFELTAIQQVWKSSNDIIKRLITQADDRSITLILMKKCTLYGRYSFFLICFPAPLKRVIRRARSFLNLDFIILVMQHVITKCFRMMP